MPSRKVRVHVKRRRLSIDELIDICGRRGISSAHLSEPVHLQHTAGVFIHNTSTARYWDNCVARAERINAAGLTAQLHYLWEVWGQKKLVSELMSTGGVLDAIVRSSGSSPAEIENDIGRNNVDECGDVL